MKRTLKRESKVLEIVRREAIGAGGSSSGPAAVQWCLLVGEGRSGGERSRASALCPSRGAHHALSPGDEPASASCLRVADGRWGSKGPAGRPHGRVPPARPSVPAIAGAEEPINPCPRGRGSASSWRARVRGSGTDARVRDRRSVARVHLWWVSDAGGTALIDPS
jgi:hypothetical protein